MYTNETRLTVEYLFLFLFQHQKHKQTRPAGSFSWSLRLNSVESSKLTELEVWRMREAVRPWLEVTRAETGGQSGQTNFILTAHTLGSLATGDCSL